MYRAVFVILSGNALNALLMLARNILIARLISVENFGIAATFGLALAIIEMTSTFGLQQQLVQDKRGNNPEFQAALQGFQIIRGLVNAAVLFLLAAPFAQFMGVPEVIWAHQLIVVVLILNGLVHFDVHRLSRQMRYGPAAIAAAISPLAALLAVWPLYLIFGDYQVMLWSLILQAAATAVMSHLVAERPYRVRFDRAVIGQSLRFGWPLLVDGLLLFAIFNGDKLIVGREFGMGQLALFTMAVTLTMTPGLIFQKSASSFFLPQLSAVADDPARFRSLAFVTLQTHVLCAGLLAVGVVICGSPFVTLVLGAKYQEMEPYLILLAVMQALRVIKGGSATVSLSQARTSNGMLANILRIAVLPLAWYVAASGGSVVTLIWIGILGEACGTVVSLGLLRGQLHLSLRPMLLSLTACVGLLMLTGVGASGGLPGLWVYVLIAGVAALPLAVPDLRLYLRHRRMTHHGGN